MNTLINDITAPATCIDLRTQFNLYRRRPYFKLFEKMYHFFFLNKRASEVQVGFK